jgi:hypothetical protein
VAAHRIRLMDPVPPATIAELNPHMIRSAA